MIKIRTMRRGPFGLRGTTRLIRNNLRRFLQIRQLRRILNSHSRRPLTLQLPPRILFRPLLGHGIIRHRRRRQVFPHQKRRRHVRRRHSKVTHSVNRNSLVLMIITLNRRRFFYHLGNLNRRQQGGVKLQLTSRNRQIVTRRLTVNLVRGLPTVILVL